MFFHWDISRGSFPYSHLPTHCMPAYSLHACISITCILTLAYFALGCFRSSPYTVVEVSVCKCKCRSVSVCSANVVEVSVCKCKCRSVSVQGIFRKNPSQCFREKTSGIFCQFLLDTFAKSACWLSAGKFWLIFLKKVVKQKHQRKHPLIRNSEDTSPK